MGQATEPLQSSRADGLGWVLIGPQSSAQSEVDRQLSELDHHVVDFRTGPYRYRYALLRGGAATLGDLPVISLTEPMIGWRRAFKRGCDILISMLAMLVFLPLMACIAAAIKLTSAGPVFFFQTRFGVNGKTFQLVKFRTMHANAERETGPVWAKNHDPRCTRIGAFLRRTSLDELPQLWNVLKGEMSLVGPRPERPIFIDQFSKQIPNYLLRHSVKGGMTGWAQVNGWRGNTSLDERLAHDLHYIQNWSPAFDLKILGRTLIGGFLNRNAY